MHHVNKSIIFQNLPLWPERLTHGAEIADLYYQQMKETLPKEIKHLVFVGMGGSGIAGRIIQTFLEQHSAIPSFVLDSCQLPHFVTAPTTLAFVTTYSGNTWETLQVLHELRARNIAPIILTHGGKAQEIAHRQKLPIALMPYAETPRSALAFFLGFMLRLLDLIGIYQGTKLIEDFKQQAALHIPFFIKMETFDTFLEKVSNREFFHVWGVRGDSAACAYRAQTQFNENSKLQAVFSAFPELSHNLIVGFTGIHLKPLVVLFATEFLPDSLKKAVEATEEILTEKGVDLYKPPLFGDTFEKQLFNMILWADFASCYVALQKKVDIDSVTLIDQLKEKHRQKGITF